MFFISLLQVDIYAGSVFLYEAVGWNVYLSAACILAITAVYTVLGGLTAVFFTDVLQCTIMIIGAIVVAIMSFSKVGGMDGLWEKYGSAIGQSITTTTVAPTTVASNFTTVAAALSTVTSTASNHSSNQTADSCFKLTPYWGNLVRPLDDPDYPWLGLWTSLFITSVWYFCTDQVKCEKKSNFIC
ncbi:sodium/glucose cotransporter 5-like [Orbicella faveolata]|uniref:sodium/glucose cotransporter 5-like n=1 Tax=Orbicella faveolata TaxID=48498 RepID=UPI0009E23E3E|nr:sodium/glucose cotransporter 5-like [Orbicella faveolata]XP_020600521.1 sodium/glucose cotransporter 5-like [Orbicella faveolata]